MKLCIKNDIFVQEYDLVYLTKAAAIKKVLIPNSILDNYTKKMLKVDKKTKFNFIKFSQPEEIEFLKQMDFILDFGDFSNLSNEEILEIQAGFAYEKNEILKKFYDLSEKEKNISYSFFVKNCTLIDYKINSVWDFLRYRKSEISFKLPKEFNRKKKISRHL